jgi:hypothetical protein
MDSNDDFLAVLFREMVISRVRQAEKYKVTYEDVQATSEFLATVRAKLTTSEVVEIYGAGTSTTIELLKIYRESLHEGALDAWSFFDRLDPVNKRKLIQWGFTAQESQVRNANDFFRGVWSHVGVMQLEDIYGDRAQEVIATWHQAKRGPCCMDAWMFYNALVDEDKKLLVDWYNARMKMEYRDY